VKGDKKMIAKFADAFPDYERYSNKDYLLNKVTSRLLRQVANIFLKGLRNKVQTYGGKGRMDLNTSLKELCNIVCESADLEKTNSWDWYFLLEDYQTAFQRFLVKPLPRFMDAASKITLEFLDGDAQVIKDLNEAFADNNFGYRLQNSPASPWIRLDPKAKAAKTAEENSEAQVAEAQPWQKIMKQLEQALKVLDKTEEESAKQAALKECLAAIEILLQEVTHTEKIEDAWKVMNTLRK
jgi:hypothetical protein